MNKWITGVDIGGSHITVCLLDAAEGRVLEHTLVRHHVDASGTAPEVIRTWAQAIRSSAELAGEPVGKIGIAMPGPFDYENGISLIKGLAKYEALYELPVKDLLAAELGIESTQIRMVNDATAYVIGECALGGAKSEDDVLGITLGTGLGSARRTQGQVTDGDLYCFPFLEKTAEEYLSTRWFLSEYQRRTGKQTHGVKDLALLAREEADVRALFEEFGSNLARVIQLRYADDLPEVVVVGGNISRAWTLFVPALKGAMPASTSIRPATLGESAALIGAAWLWSTGD